MLLKTTWKKYIVFLQDVNIRKQERQLVMDTFERIIKLYNRINNANISIMQMKRMQ